MRWTSSKGSPVGATQATSIPSAMPALVTFMSVLVRRRVLQSLNLDLELTLCAEDARGACPCTASRAGIGRMGGVEGCEVWCEAAAGAGRPQDDQEREYRDPRGTSVDRAHRP